MRKLWVKGEALHGGSAAIDVIDPATEAVIGQACQGDAADVDRAVRSARQAFPRWRDTPASERAALFWVFYRSCAKNNAKRVIFHPL